LKRRRDDENRDMRWVRHEIASIKETLEEMGTEAREERQYLTTMLEALDCAGMKGSFDEMKESFDEMSYDVRNNLRYSCC
jgi:polyphosphate kinase 2 (PPK2 family)